MIIREILSAAQPFLQGRTIKDAIVGLTLIGIQLDNGSVGISYMLREELPAGCSSFPYGQELIGKSALEIAQWAVTGTDDAKRGIAMAVLTAASESQDLKDVDGGDKFFGIEVKPEDCAGIVGFIAPIVKELQQITKEVLVFDQGMWLRGNYKNDVSIHPTEEQSQLLPNCNIVVLTGTTIINHTIDDLLFMCKNAREVIIVGPSTPMYPQAFKDTNVKILAGSWWNGIKKEEIFKEISLACGISHLHQYMNKKSVEVRI
jgi:uncharacterized protein (DUF4213/DUF364 family)